MNINNIPLSIINWNKEKPQESIGESGFSTYKLFEEDGIRLRLVEYSKNYMADHWCNKGHIIYILEGDLTLEIDDGKKYNLSEGMSFIISDNIDIHRVYSVNGAKVFVVD